LTFNLPQFKRRTSDLPLYTVTQTGTGAVKIVTDPGLALITHSFANTGGMKPPQLRDLAARAPYFHNGAAETLDDLVDFYDQNFSIGLTRREHRALVAFLNAI
jgi:cytochrome c peroxidase